MGEFCLGEDGASIQRWKGLTSFAKNAAHDDIEALLRLALGSRQPPAADRLSSFQEAFRKVDPDFSTANNSRELQVLAACTLIYIAQTPGNNVAPGAALAMATSSVESHRKNTLPGDLLEIAQEALRNLSIGMARRPELPPSLGQEYKPLFEASVQKIKSQPDFTGTADALTMAGSATTRAINGIQGQSLAAFRALETRLNQQDEELQMLWWLLGGRSEDLDHTFHALPTKIRPLILGKELADHTLIPPGPPSVRALLSRAGLEGKAKIKLVAAVGACPANWLKSLAVPEIASPVTQPIHFAIVRQLETGPGTDWVPGWAAATDLSKDISFTPLTLAELFYRERLLTRLYEVPR